MTKDQKQPRRRPGNSAGITRARIVASARTIGPDALTMQAVADDLGVDRKAITYHVSDRDELLTLLAVDSFQARFKSTVIPEGAAWDHALLAYGVAVAKSIIASGSLALYFRLSGEPDVESVRPAEALLESLIRGGFTEDSAARAISMVTNLAMGFAQDVHLNGEPGGHPQSPELHRLLDESRNDEFTILRNLDNSGFAPYDDTQLDFVLRTTVAGLAAQLAGPAASTTLPRMTAPA
ncbi:TetR/AcrR family transcriptional regulator [Paenarthrobacter sp. NPDC058040]|uniref:TetR/AcrR family transcriptional regulator n=1 Tax=unclassified Paenarthrobacter TaxID=2634190 RepID=UPI0036DDB72C